MSIFRKLSFLILLLASGCGSSSNQVAVTESEILVLARAQDEDPQVLSRGRTLYLTACTSCHSPVNITSLDRVKWADILPLMSAQAGLDTAEFADLKSYIQAILVQQNQGSRGNGY